MSTIGSAASRQVGGSRTAAFPLQYGMEKVVQDQIDRLGWRQFMENPDYQFMPELINRARWVQRSIRGSDEDELVQRLYFSILLPPDGGLWSFRPESGNPLEGFYKSILKNRAMTYFRDEMGAKSRMPSVSISPRKDEDERGSVSEQTLGERGESPVNIAETNELLRDFREWLSGERLGGTLVRIFDKMMDHILNSPNAPLIHKDLAEWVGLSSGQLSHYMAMIKQSLMDFAEDEPEILSVMKRLQQAKSSPPVRTGPRSGTWTPPGGQPIEIIVIRRGENTAAIKRKDGQLWEDGKVNKNVPKSQLEIY
jgi:hypothetical protein